MKIFIGCVILVSEVLFFQDILSAPTKSNTASLGESVTNLQAGDSGLSKGESASFSSSLHITHDPSSNSFKTIDTGAAEVIVATDNTAGVKVAIDNTATNLESVLAVGSSVKLEATVETAKGFSNSVSLTGDALSGSGTGQSVSVGSGPLVTHHEHDSFDTKADLKNVETLKTVETSGGSSEKLPEKSADTTGIETLKEADTSDIGENATVEIQVVETLKTVEEKAIEKKLLELGITTQKPTLPPSIEIIPDGAESISPQFLDIPAPLERLELPKPVKASKPFLDASIYTSKTVEPEIVAKLLPVKPLTSTEPPKTEYTTAHPLEGKITLDFKATDLPLLPTDMPLLTTDTQLSGTDATILAPEPPDTPLSETGAAALSTDPPLVVTESPLVVTESPLATETDSTILALEPPDTPLSGTGATALSTDPPLVVTESPLATETDATILTIEPPDTPLSGTGAIALSTDPPLVVTESPLVVTESPLATETDATILALEPPDTPLSGTGATTLLTDPPLVVTESPLVVTESPLATENDATILAPEPPDTPSSGTGATALSTDPPLVVTETPFVVTESPLVVTESPLVSDPSINAVDTPLMHPVSLEVPSENSSMGEITVTDIQPDPVLKEYDSKVFSESATVPNITSISKDNIIIEIDPLLESILDNSEMDVINDNSNPVRNNKIPDTITITKTDSSFLSSSVQLTNDTSFNSSFNITIIDTSVSSSADSKTDNFTSSLNEDQVLDINALKSKDPTNDINIPKLDINTGFGIDQLTGTNSPYGTDKPIDLNTFLRSIETGNPSNAVHYPNMDKGTLSGADKNNAYNTDTSLQMDINVFPKADLIVGTDIGTDLTNFPKTDQSSVQSDKTIYTLPLTNQLDKDLYLDGSAGKKNLFIDTNETLNQEGSKSKSMPSEGIHLSEGTFTVSTGFTESPPISTTMTDSSFSVNTFNADRFVDQSMNNFLTEDSKTRRNTFFSGQSKGDLLATSSSALDWLSFLNLAPSPSRNSDLKKSSEFSRNTVTEHETNLGTNFRNNFFDTRTTTLEPEFQGLSQPCMMKKHTDPSKFYSSGIEMSCPPLLIWKQNKCYCDYPGPGDQTVTIATADDTGNCDFLLKLDMENTYQNKYSQFKVDTRGQRRRITFENVKGGKGLAAHIVRSPLLVNAFQGNDLTATMHIKFKFRIAKRRLNSRRLMILVSNGCGSSWNGPQPPSIALKFIPHNSTFKLVFRTDGKSVVEFLQPTVNPHDGWYHVALYLQDQWLTLEINKEKLYSSNGMKGSVIITPCPLKITGNTFEGYIDEFEVAKKCRYKSG